MIFFMSFCDALLRLSYQNTVTHIPLSMSPGTSITRFHLQSFASRDHILRRSILSIDAMIPAETKPSRSKFPAPFERNNAKFRADGNNHGKTRTKMFSDKFNGVVI